MTTTARERLERIELSDGRILRMGNTCEFMVDESKAPDALGRVVNLAEGFAAIATEFAAAMAPQQAAPVRSAKVQEAMEFLRRRNMPGSTIPLDHEFINQIIDAGMKLFHHVEALEQQSDTSGLREALKEVKRMSLDNAYSKGQCGLVASKALAANPEGGVGNA